MIYALGILVTLLVCVSRVYLLAHLPADGIAGIGFGYTLVIAFAWQLHKGDLFDIKLLAPMLSMLCVLSIGSYDFYSFSGQLVHYGLSVSS